MDVEKAVKGNGYLQLNTPVALGYTTEERIGSDDLQVKARIDTISVDATIQWWRRGLDEFRGQHGIRVRPTAAEPLQTLTDAPTQIIRSHHLFQGQTQFAYRILDVAGGVVQPRLYREDAGTAENSTVEEELGVRFTKKDELSESKRVAYELLLRLFKQGSQIGASEEDTGKNGVPQRAVLRVTKKRRLEPHAEEEVRREDSDLDDLDSWGEQDSLDDEDGDIFEMLRQADAALR